jgi:hypothetical protein
VLHVVDSTRGVGGCTAAYVATLARRDDSRAILIGTAADEREARSAGLEPIAVFAPPLGAPVLATRAWREILRAAMAAQPIAKAVCWSVASAAATARALPEAHVVCALASGPDLGAASALARRIASFRPDEATALSERAAELTRSSLQWKVHRMEPEVDGSWLRNDRERVRRRWSAREHEFVVGLLGDPIDVVDARRGSDIVGIAAVRGLPVRLVVHPSSARFARSKRWMDEVRIASFLTGDVLLARPWEALCGLDAALILRDGISVAGAAARGRGRAGLDSFWTLREQAMSPLPALWAARAGVPLIVEAGALDDALLRELEARVFDSDDPLAATRALVDLASHGNVTPTDPVRIPSARTASRP